MTSPLGMKAENSHGKHNDLLQGEQMGIIQKSRNVCPSTLSFLKDYFLMQREEKPDLTSSETISGHPRENQAGHGFKY